MNFKELKDHIHQSTLDRFLLEDISLNDILELFQFVDDFIAKIDSDAQIQIKDYFPDNFFPSGEIRIDYVELIRGNADVSTSLLFQLSWEGAALSIIPDMLEVNDLAVSIEIIGSSLAVQVDGNLEIDGFKMLATVAMPAIYLEARMVNSDPDSGHPSPLKLLKRFQATPFSHSDEDPAPSTNQHPKLDDLLIMARPDLSRVIFQIGIKDLVIGPVKMDMRTQLSYTGGDVAGSFWGDFLIEIDDTKKILILVSSEHDGPDSGWQLEGGVALSGINILDLAVALKKQFGITSGPELPTAFSGSTAELTYIYVSFNTESKAFTFSCSLDFHNLFGLDKPSEGNEVELNLDFNFTPYEKDGKEEHELTFSGQIIFQLDKSSPTYPEAPPLKLEFDLVFDKGDDGKTLVAAYKDLGGGKIQIKDLIALFTEADVNDLDFEIDLKQAYFISKTKRVNGQNKQQFILGLDIDGGINLSKLPLVGQLAPHANRLSINIQPLYASSTYSTEELSDFQNIVPGDSLALPDKIDKAGADITIALNLGDEPIKFELPISLANVNPESNESVDNNVEESNLSPQAENSSDDGTHWFNLQKSFGPVSFQRLGVKYQDKKFWFKIDGALTAAGLTLSLEGLGIGVELPHISTPSFELHGLGLDFKKGEFEIGGSFLRVKGIPGVTEDEYDGMAVMKYKELGLSAIGSYSRIDGHPSLFLYAVLDYPIGGPAFFFVTGLAAGFGYNRQLKMPVIDKVQNFPMVVLATNTENVKTPAKDVVPSNKLENVINSLHDYIAPAAGEYFIAAGIKFNSFKLIDSFVLLSVSFGVHFEIGLLGLSSLVVPTPDVSGSDVKPLAVANLALRGAFLPEEGFIGIEAKLTSDSYIFDQACHLTGGFAFYSWFKGEHEGDFVLTLGGYHPDFKVPAHYPKVPRLGVNWQISSSFSVIADFYFALTANALMAGGHVNATYHSGDIKAWFDAGIDFIISWKPYFYDASFNIGMGVDVTIHFIGTYHLSFHLGASVHVWGPEFSGTATIDLCIVSFTVSFGSGKTVPAYITWEEFQRSFIPDPEKVCSATVTKGKIGEVDKEDGKHFLINAKELELTLNTAIPITKVNADITIDTEIKPSKIGLKPVKGATSDNFSSSFDLEMIGPSKLNDFHFEPIFKKVPAAMWGQPSTEVLLDNRPPAPDLNGDQFVEKALSGFKLTAMHPPKSTKSKSIKRDNIKYTTHHVNNGFSFEEEHSFKVKEIDNEKQYINGHILDQEVVSNRNQLLKAIGFQSATIDLDNAVADSFLEMPIIGDY